MKPCDGQRGASAQSHGREQGASTLRAQARRPLRTRSRPQRRIIVGPWIKSLFSRRPARLRWLLQISETRSRQALRAKTMTECCSRAKRAHLLASAGCETARDALIGTTMCSDHRRPRLSTSEGSRSLSSRKSLCQPTGITLLREGDFDFGIDMLAVMGAKLDVDAWASCAFASTSKALTSNYRERYSFAIRVATKLISVLALPRTAFRMVPLGEAAREAAVARGGARLRQLETMSLRIPRHQTAEILRTDHRRSRAPG